MSLPDSLGDASNVLLLGSSLNAGTRRTVMELMAGSEPRETTLVVVSYTCDPGTWVCRWRDRVGVPPAQVRFVSVTDATSLSSVTSDSVVTEQATPGDLTGIGIAVSNSLEAWRKTDTRGVAAFDSVTAMLQYSSEATAFRFLHTLTTRFRAVDACAYYHLDPGAHHDQTVARFTHLFDAVLEVDEEDDAVVTS